jgi:hypothetical protein
MAIEKKLFVYDAGIRDGTMDFSKPQHFSGVRATIFGASGINHLIQATSDAPSQRNWASPTAVWLCPSVWTTISDTLNT